MIRSRLRRFEEKNAKRKILIGILGSVAVIVLLIVFGVKLLIAFSLGVEQLRGNPNVTPTPQQAVLLPPVLDPLPEATNSATLIVTGSGTANKTVVLYVNGGEYQRAEIAADGTFSFSGIPVETGSITITAKLTDGKNTFSDVSNTISTTISRTAPKLTIDSPSDNQTINDGSHKVTVNGLTDPDARVTINGRIVIVKSDGSFSYDMPLSNGQTTLTITATDAAGNTTTVTKNVTYQS